MKDNQTPFGYRTKLLTEMEELGEKQRSQEISYEEYHEEFRKRNELYHKLLQESEELGHFDR